MKLAVLQNRWVLGLANRDLQLHVGMKGRARSVWP